MRFISICLIGLFVLSGCTPVPVRDGVDNSKASDANASLGVAYMMKGNYEVAMRKLKKAIQYNEDNPDAHHYIAELYNRIDENKLAEKHFEIALDLAPQDSSIKNNYGIFLCGQKKVKEGVELFENVLNDPLYKNKGKAYENMGVCTLSSGNIFQAKNYFQQALTINKNLPTSLLSMAQIEFDKQHINLAAQYLSRFNKNSTHTAQSLWLGYLIERKLGNKNRTASYSVLLKGKFPDSKEAKLLEKLQSRNK